MVHELKAACLAYEKDSLIENLEIPMVDEMAVYTADNFVASSVVSMDVPTVDLLTAQIVVSFLIRRLPRAVSKIDVKVVRWNGCIDD